MSLHPWLSNAAIISYQVLESRYFAFPNSIEFWFIVERHDTKVFIRLIASETAWDLDAIKCIVAIHRRKKVFEPNRRIYNQ